MTKQPAKYRKIRLTRNGLPLVVHPSARDAYELWRSTRPQYQLCKVPDKLKEMHVAESCPTVVQTARGPELIAGFDIVDLADDIGVLEVAARVLSEISDEEIFEISHASALNIIILKSREAVQAARVLADHFECRIGHSNRHGTAAFRYRSRRALADMAGLDRRRLHRSKPHASRGLSLSLEGGNR